MTPGFLTVVLGAIIFILHMEFIYPSLSACSIQGHGGYLNLNIYFKKCLVTFGLTLTHSIPNVYCSLFGIKHMTGYIGLIDAL